MKLVLSILLVLTLIAAVPAHPKHRKHGISHGNALLQRAARLEEAIDEDPIQTKDKSNNNDSEPTHGSKALHSSHASHKDDSKARVDDAGDNFWRVAALFAGSSEKTENNVADACVALFLSGLAMDGSCRDALKTVFANHPDHMKAAGRFLEKKGKLNTSRSAAKVERAVHQRSVPQRGSLEEEEDEDEESFGALQIIEAMDEMYLDEERAHAALDPGPYHVPGEHQATEAVLLSHPVTRRDTGEPSLLLHQAIVRAAGVVGVRVEAFTPFKDAPLDTYLRQVTAELDERKRQIVHGADFELPPSRETVVEVSDAPPAPSSWMRDFGPIFRCSTGARDAAAEVAAPAPPPPSATAFQYQRGAVATFAFPQAYSDMKGIDFDGIDLAAEGGNLLINGEHCMMSTAVLIRGFVMPAASATEAFEEMFDTLDGRRNAVREALRARLGCRYVYFLPPLLGEATGHLDMFMAWASHNRLLLGQYHPTGDPQNSALLNLIHERLPRMNIPGYTGDTVVRVVMPSNCPDFRAIDAECDRARTTYLPDGYARDRRVFRSFINAVMLRNTETRRSGVVMPVYGSPDWGNANGEGDAVSIWRQFVNVVVTGPADIEIAQQGAVHCYTRTLPVCH